MGMLKRTDGQRRAQPKQRTLAMRGFSMVEMMMVIAIMIIIAGFAMVSTQGALRDARVNGAYDTAFTALRQARERAIEERKRYIVTFGTPAITGASTPLGAPTAKSVQLFRWDAFTPSTAVVQISTIDLPSDVAFQTLSGIPVSAATVPDGFGVGAVPIDFDQGIVSGGNLVMFMPDGSAHDLAGNSNSGILYVARNSDLKSSRAVTVFGNSGRVRGWRLSLTGGVASWIQQ
jgi:prepilin-type N-terminal cleavage/methylation domain-containing protein